MPFVLPQTLAKRQLKREIVLLRKDLPKGWMPMIEVEHGGDRAVVFPLSPSDKEYGVVRTRFKENGGVFGAKIQEVNISYHGPVFIICRIGRDIEEA
jgi:hypothetical protein